MLNRLLGKETHKDTTTHGSNLPGSEHHAFDKDRLASTDRHFDKTSATYQSTEPRTNDGSLPVIRQTGTAFTSNSTDTPTRTAPMTGTGFHDQGYSGTGTSYQGQQGGFHQQGGMTQQSGLATHQIETTTTSTSVLQPTLQTQLPLTLNEDVTKEYMPLRNTDGMKELIARMEKASLEIDAYAKAKQELVSKEAVELINEEMQRCKSVQDRLNTTLRDRCNSLDDDFATRREAMMRDLDKEKAQQMINLQSELQKQQESILAQSRARIDEITMKAKQKKLEIVKAAQEQHNSVSTTVTDAAILMTPTDSINNVTISKDELRPDSGCGSCSSTSTRKCTTAGCTTSDCTGCGDSQTIRGSQFPNTGSEFNNHPGHVKSSFGRTQQEQAGMAAGRNAEEPVMRRDGHGVGQY